MEPGNLMPHSQGFSNNPYPESNQPNFSYRFHNIHSHLPLGLPKGLFPVDVPVTILKALLSSSILATRPAYLNLLDLIILTIYSP